MSVEGCPDARGSSSVIHHTSRFCHRFVIRLWCSRNLIVSAHSPSHSEILTRDDEEDDYDTDLDNSHLFPLATQLHTSHSCVTSDSDSTNSDSPTSEPDDSEPQPNPSVLANKVKHVLTQMSAVGLTLPQFLHVVSWGDTQCVKDAQIRGARTALMNSELLPDILENWWKPPRLTTSHKARSHAAHGYMVDFATRCIHDVIDDEIEGVMLGSRSNPA